MAGPTLGLIPNYNGAFGNPTTNDPTLNQSTHELQNIILGVNTSKITVSSTPPSSPTLNDLWVDIS